MASPLEISVVELDRLRRGGGPHAVLDVREPWETSICSIDGSLNIPLTMIPQSLERIPRDRPLVVMCHHGGRSARAVEWLRQNGFESASNLTGGIDAWARQVDTTMATY